MRKMPWHNQYGLAWRMRELWWVLTGKWSLHTAWQAGYDDGHQDEYKRLIVNKAAVLELRHREITRKAED